MEKPKRVFTGAPWEKEVGYCRAIRVGNQVFISGTAPVADDGSVYAPGDAYRQTKRCIEIAKNSLLELGASLSHVMRTRMFVTDISQWKAIGKAHNEYFGEYPPVTTMVEVKSLIAPHMLIEIEIDAVVQ